MQVSFLSSSIWKQNKTKTTDAYSKQYIAEYNNLCF